MLSIGSEYTVEPYKSYKNRTVTKHLDKIKNQLRQINDCSLKADDKAKLKEQLLAIIKNDKP